MSEARAEAAFVLLFCMALTGACDRSPERPVPAPAIPSAGPIKAADPACALPLGRFASHRTQLTGSFLDYPTNLVLIDRVGGLRWNGVPVGPQRLGEYVEHQARIEPPPILVIQPVRDAPCAVVRKTLSTALGLGRCTPQSCAFEWPGAMAPPLLPEPSKLLGKWVLVSIDDAPPPPDAPPIEVTFAEGEVGAQSQCLSFAWLYGVRDGQLQMRVPNRVVEMCARGLSDWERTFQAAMPAAASIESDGSEMHIIGPKGKLKLRRSG